jgi:serine phosphatase RsbU (regulator of sigma subunit)
MRLRTQLIVAFILLSVLPLAGVTLYSYRSSLRAFHEAVRADSRALAEEMRSRVGSVTADLKHRIDRLSGLPVWAVSGPDPAEIRAHADRLQRLIAADLGDAARYIQEIEFVPPPGAGAPSAPQEDSVRVELTPDLGEATERAGETQIVLGTRDGRLVVRHVAPTAPAPPVPPVAPTPATHPRVTGDAAESRGGLDILKGMEALSKELESRDLQRRRGIDLPAADEADLMTLLSTDLGAARPAGARELLGTVKAQVSSREVLRQVLSRTRRERGEIPFAVDSKGKIYTHDTADMPELTQLRLGERIRNGGELPPDEFDANWVTVIEEDPSTGLYFGIARPVGEGLQSIRAAAVRNLGYGLGMVALAILGILPLSARISHNLERLTEGAARLGTGDLGVRVPVRSRDEFGVLAGAFNKMAEELGEGQKRLVQQERLQREVEIARQIQQELLPRGSLMLPLAEVKGFSIPAREVGGDFFNYFALPGGEMAILVGDVSGKGVPAALLMANVQALLKARLPLERDLAALATLVDREVEATTPREVFVTLFVGILDAAGGSLRYVNAGHNPPFAFHRGGAIERLDPTGRPIGLLSGGGYRERRMDCTDGCFLFLYTDGLVESESPSGEAFGMDRLEALLQQGRDGALDGLLVRIEEDVRRFRGGQEAADDATLLAVRLGGTAGCDGVSGAAA